MCQPERRHRQFGHLLWAQHGDSRNDGREDGDFLFPASVGENLVLQQPQETVRPVQCHVGTRSVREVVELVHEIEAVKEGASFLHVDDIAHGDGGRAQFVLKHKYVLQLADQPVGFFDARLIAHGVGNASFLWYKLFNLQVVPCCRIFVQVNCKF